MKNSLYQLVSLLSRGPGRNWGWSLGSNVALTAWSIMGGAGTGWGCAGSRSPGLVGISWGRRPGA